MTGSSPASQRNYPWSSSPEQHRLSDFLQEDRNSELSHKDALAKAKALHDRVREDAIRVIFDHEQKLEEQRLKLEQLRLLERQEHIRAKQRVEEERLRREREVRAEEERLRALEAQTVPKLPPKPPVPAQQPPTDQASSDADGAQAEPSRQSAATPPAAAKVVASIAGQRNGHATVPSSTPAPSQPAVAVSQATPFNPFAPRSATTPSSTTPAANPFSKQGTPSTTPAHNPFASTASKAQAPATAGIQPPAARTNGIGNSTPSRPVVDDRYTTIHKNLKRLRAYMSEQTKSNPTLKNRVGDMRREIRKSLGQLTNPNPGEKGANKKQLETVKTLLTEALTGRTPSALVNVSDYTLDDRQPVEGAVNNDLQLPSLFIYLLNQFSKAMINQFINECAAAPKSAEPVGILAAQVFAFAAFHWRGKSLIDILMAKFRVACPVLFGYRGNEKTEQGRARLGWKQEYGQWVPEQQHTDRMKGLGVGYASIAMRDFSRSKSTNAWPPSHYWSSLARIVNTPPAEISDTQCVVLRSMIQLYEQKFLTFYGTAAVAALRKALVEFPAKALTKTTGVKGLSVLAEVYKRDFGLDLK